MIASSQPRDRAALGERLGERDAERVLIRRCGRRCPCGLLRCHVARRAGEPEVEHAHAPVVAADRVVGLEVAMDHAGGVRGAQPFTGGAIQPDDLAHRARRGGAVRAQRLTAHPLHHEVDLLADLTDVVDRDDVRMRQLRECLALEHDALARGLQALLDQLDRDAPVELGIPRTPDHAGATGADLFEQLIAAELHRLVDLEQVLRDAALADRARDGVDFRRLAEVHTFAVVGHRSSRVTKKTLSRDPSRPL